MDPVRKAAAVSLAVPAAVEAGSVMVVRVRAEDTGGAAVRGEVALLRTIAYRYRERRDGGGTHLATARRTDIAAIQSLPPVGGSDGGYDAELLLLVPASGPPNADTGLVAVDWAVRVRLAVGDEPATQAVEKVRVVSSTGDVGVGIESPPRRADSGQAVVTIHGLSTRRVKPGMCLTGTVGVQPLHPGLIRGVRLDLVLRERVLRGPAGSVSYTHLTLPTTSP